MESRRRELQLQLQQQQQQQQQTSSSSSGTSLKTETKSSLKVLPNTASNANEKEISPMHQPSNTSPQSTNQSNSDRNMDTSTSNGGVNYGMISDQSPPGTHLEYHSTTFLGHPNSSLTSQSHLYHPPSHPNTHPNTHQSSNAGNYTQMSNGNDNTSHSSYTNNTNHIAGWIEKISSLMRKVWTGFCHLFFSSS